MPSGHYLKVPWMLGDSWPLSYLVLYDAVSAVSIAIRLEVAGNGPVPVFKKRHCGLFDNAPGSNTRSRYPGLAIGLCIVTLVKGPFSVGAGSLSMLSIYH